MTIYLVLNGKVVFSMFTLLDYETLKRNWWIVKRMANVEDLQ